MWANSTIVVACDEESTRDEAQTHTAKVKDLRNLVLA
jgi:hypothetical protein